MTMPTTTLSNPVEIELKLALPADQVARFMKLMARRRCVPVQQNLMTRYYDTPDFALSAQGIALRVRKAGRRWLQTLKTEGERQGGLSRRAEYEMAVPNNKPDWARFPAAAQAWVPAALRAKLIPVFETQFTRTAWLLGDRGKTKVEVALDVGEVRAGKRRQSICEIEIELKAGKPDALFVLAERWAGQLDCLPLDASKAERGVRLARGDAAAPAKAAPIALRDDMRVEAGFAAIIQSCLAQFQSNLPGVLASDDIEYVHQARVALRRLRAALHLARRACVLPEALLEGLHAMAAALGPARDWDVLCCVTLPAIASHYSDEDAWQVGLSVLEARRAEARSAMRVQILNARPGGWLLALQRWLMRQAWRDDSESRRRVQLLPLKKWARRKLRQGHQTITRKARAYKKLSPAERHALRIAIKRQRYAAEFFQDLSIAGYGVRYQAALQDIQESSGRINDCRVANRLLKRRCAGLGAMGEFARARLAECRAGADKTRLERQLKNFVK